MAVQTTVAAQAAGLNGQLAEGVNYKRRSLLNEETSAVAFGVGVQQGAVDRGFALPSASDDIFAGITCHEYALDNADESEGIAADETNSVVEDGVVWVLPEENVTPADDVYWRYTVNAGDAELTPGRFGASTDSGKNTVLTNARWLDTASKDNLCRLQINLPL